jgi:hypothetical protein
MAIFLARRPSFCKKKPRSQAGHVVEQIPSEIYCNRVMISWSTCFEGRVRS